MFSYHFNKYNANFPLHPEPPTQTAASVRQKQMLCCMLRQVIGPLTTRRVDITVNNTPITQTFVQTLIVDWITMCVYVCRTLTQTADRSRGPVM